MNQVNGPDPIIRQQYQDNGFTFSQKLLNHNEAIELLELLQPALDGKLGHVGFGEKGNKEIKYGRQQQIAILENGLVPKLTEHPYRNRAQQLAEYLTGYSLRFAYGQVVSKPPHYNARVQWHQDGYYWQKSHRASELGISCWVALTDSHFESGAVGYVMESHRTGINPHMDAVGNYEFHSAFEVSDPSPNNVVYAHLAPGDAAFHHSLCIHGSSGNRTAKPRICIVSHFFPIE